jgi:hypothetical protein
MDDHQFKAKRTTHNGGTSGSANAKTENAISMGDLEKYGQIKMLCITDLTLKKKRIMK